MFPLILLQAKAGGTEGEINGIGWNFVSINSPSGEGGGPRVKIFLHVHCKTFPLILLQAKAGGLTTSPGVSSVVKCFH